MIKHLLTGVTALGLLTGVALAQSAPGTGSSTTTETTSSVRLQHDHDQAGHQLERQRGQ